MKLLVSDLDGTLLNKEKKISEKVRKAIERWREAGNAFVIATGRLYPSAAFYRDELAMEPELICCSGAVIYRGESVLSEHPMDPDLATRLWEITRRRGVYAQYYSHNALIANRNGEFMEGYARTNARRPVSLRTELIIRENLCVEEPIHKLSFVTWDPLEAQEILEEMRPLEGVHVFRSLEHLYDIISDESSKGTSALYLKEVLGASRVYGIGDNENDVDLLQMADHSAVMASAPERVLHHADVIVPEADEDGVAVYIDAILEGQYE